MPDFFPQVSKGRSVFEAGQKEMNRAFPGRDHLGHEGWRVAPTVVDDPTPAIRQLDDITTRKKTLSGRGVRAFNPLSREDIQLFKAMMAGEHHIRGLSNADIRMSLHGSMYLQNLAAKSCPVDQMIQRLPRRSLSRRSLFQTRNVQWGVHDIS